ncbi:MAG: PHP domain-containing protein [Archaeoglobaceae archaeon]
MFKAELHVHSKFSDGRDSVKRIIASALKKRIDVLSITDHDTINGSLEAIEVVEAEKLPIIIIPGIEVSSSTGHILAYGIWKEVEKGLSVSATCRVIKSLGGVSVLAHPFDFLRKGSIRPKDFKFPDCIEVFNAKSYFNSFAKFFAKKYEKKGIGGSDAHSASQIGLVLNYMKSADKEGILNSFYDGRRQKIIERVTFLLSRRDQEL